MTHLLDTNTCIHLLRGNASVVNRVRRLSPTLLGISAITHYELLYGVARSPVAWKKQERDKVTRLLKQIRVLPFTTETSAQAATLRAALEAVGRPIGPMDTLIAATALEHNLSLVTNNLDEFARVIGLSCLTWCD